MKGGDTGEKDSEQKGSCQGGSLLGRIQKGCARNPWQAMPQMKGLKELKLPVGQRNGKMKKGRYGSFD